MAIGSITSTGKQNATSSGELKYKKIQKDNDSFCFLADDTVVDFASLIDFILIHGGSGIVSIDGLLYKRTSIPCARGYAGRDTAAYTSLITSQRQNDGEWARPSTILAVGYISTSGNPYISMTVDNTWTVV